MLDWIWSHAHQIPLSLEKLRRRLALNLNIRTSCEQITSRLTKVWGHG